MMAEEFRANDALLAGVGKFAPGQELDEEMREIADAGDTATIRAKARALLEVMGFPAMMDTFLDVQASHSTKLDTIKQLTALGDMAPKQNVATGASVGLHVTINAPAGYSAPERAPTISIEREILDITPTAVDELRTPEPEPVAEGPQPFAVPDFKLGQPEPTPGGKL